MGNAVSTGAPSTKFGHKSKFRAFLPHRGDSVHTDQGVI